MRKVLIRAALAAFAASMSTVASADTFYGYCRDDAHSNVISPFLTVDGSADDDDVKEQWEGAVAANLGVDTYKIDGRCYFTKDRAKAEGSYNSILGYTEEYLVQFAFEAAQVSVAAPAPNSTPRVESAEAAESEKSAASASGRSPARQASEEAAARRAAAKAEFDAKHAEWERQNAEREKQVADYEAAKKAMAEQQAASKAAAEAAAAAYKKEQDAHAEVVRKSQEEMARYEREVAAAKVLADFDKRNGLGAGRGDASTDNDANRCVTAPQTKLDDTFKGNTSASVINGCGQPVDVRICLMTDNGWNCGDRTGVQGQAVATFSSFNATGQVYVDAKVSGSSKALGRPN